LVLAGGGLFSATSLSQTEADRPEFDAASVKVNTSSDRASTRYDKTRVVLVKASIRHLILRGWPSLADYQVVWPAWVEAQRFAVGYDINVTFPPDTTPKRLQSMFQNLLADRFKLAVHWETRDLKVFEVRASEGGAKLQQAQNPAPPTDFPKYSTKVSNGQWHISSKLGSAPSGLTVSGVVEVLNGTHILDRPLVDATGIQGYYDIDLSAPAEVPGNRPDPSELLSALDKQLGLKATLKALPVKTLVIDHMERLPTED
jgi:uncharacterized protein (TIGR03435 family)